jgi:hypothetical protein
MIIIKLSSVICLGFLCSIIVILVACFLFREREVKIIGKVTNLLTRSELLSISGCPIPEERQKSGSAIDLSRCVKASIYILEIEKKENTKKLFYISKEMFGNLVIKDYLNKKVLVSYKKRLGYESVEDIVFL